MSPLEAARANLAALLGDLAITAPQDAPDPLAAVPVLDYVPEAIQPPTVLIQPAEDYVTTGEEDATFAATEYVVAEEVWALVDLVDNRAAMQELDEIVSGIILALGPSAWWVKAISQPGPVHTSEWMAHGMRLTVATYVTL